MIGNTWEWTSDEFKGSSREKQYVLRGGSYLDSVDGKKNHVARVTTRLVTVWVWVWSLCKGKGCVRGPGEFSLAMATYEVGVKLNLQCLGLRSV